MTTAIVLAAVVRFGDRRAAARTITPVLLVTVALVAAMSLGELTVGVYASALLLACKLPQAVLAYKQPGWLGLSPTALVLAVVCASLWVIYGVLIGDHTVIVTSSWLLTLNVFIAARTIGAQPLLRKADLITART